MWVCMRCGSDDIQTMAWVDVNTDEVFEQCHSWNHEEANYCSACELEDRDPHTAIGSKEEYEKAAQVKAEINSVMEARDD